MSRFSVPDMSCGHCKAKIEDALLEADGGAELDFNMEAREVTVESVLEAGEIDRLISSTRKSHPTGLLFVRAWCRY